MPHRRRTAKKTPAIIESSSSPERISSTTPPASVQVPTRKRKVAGSNVNGSSPTTSPVQAPLKKKRVVGQPTPGSVPYVLLPPVPTSSRVAAAKKLSFGSIDMEETMSEPPSPSKRSKIDSTKKKPLVSGKSKAVAPLASPVFIEKTDPKQKDTLSDDEPLPTLVPNASFPQPSAEDGFSLEDAVKNMLDRETKKTKKALDVIEISSGSESDIKTRAPVTPRFKPKSSLVRVKVEPLPALKVIDDEAQEAGSGEDTEGSLKDFIVRDSESEEEEGRLANSDDEVDAGLSEHERKEKRGKAKAVASESEEAVEFDERNAMQLEWQDPALDKFYRRMPKFVEYIEMTCQRKSSSNDSNKLFASEIMKCMATRNAVSVLASLNFESHLCFFNPSRIDPSSIAFDKSYRLIVPGTEQTAVLLTAGVTSACHLINGHNTGIGEQTNTRKEIGIMPYNQEFQLMTSNLAKILKVQRLCGPVMGNTFWFTTKKEGARGDKAWASSASVNVTPATAKFFVSPRKNKSTTTNHGLSGLKAHQYPASLKFDDNVPIYDARGFDFSAKSLENIKALPLYKGGKAHVCDLKKWSAVTVGYSGGMYTMTMGIQTGNNTFAAHVLFVLFHGVVDAEGLAE